MATQAPHESDGRVVYKGTCRPADSICWESVLAGDKNRDERQHGMEEDKICLHQPAALRLMVPPQPLAEVYCVDRHYGEVCENLASHCGDFIVRRRDGAWAYQLAVVVDDAYMGVTEVVRGRDLLLSAPQQMYVARLLGFSPPAFAHIPLLVNAQGQRLSKRDLSLDMGTLRARYSPEQLLGKLALLTGMAADDTPITARELLQGFSWERIPHEDIVCPQNHIV